MKNYSFARNARREYFEVQANSEEEALALLEEGEMEYYTGRQDSGEDFELIDIDDEGDEE